MNLNQAALQLTLQAFHEKYFTVNKKFISIHYTIVDEMKNIFGGFQSKAKKIFQAFHSHFEYILSGARENQRKH